MPAYPHRRNLRAPISDEHDDGGFGHTPWGVGLQNRFPKTFVPGETPAPPSQFDARMHTSMPRSALDRLRAGIQRWLRRK